MTVSRCRFTAQVSRQAAGSEEADRVADRSRVLGTRPGLVLGLSVSRVARKRRLATASDGDSQCDPVPQRRHGATSSVMAGGAWSGMVGRIGRGRGPWNIMNWRPSSPDRASFTRSRRRESEPPEPAVCHGASRCDASCWRARLAGCTRGSVPVHVPLCALPPLESGAVWYAGLRRAAEPKRARAQRSSLECVVCVH